MVIVDLYFMNFLCFQLWKIKSHVNVAGAWPGVLLPTVQVDWLTSYCSHRHKNISEHRHFSDIKEPVLLLSSDYNHPTNGFSSDNGCEQ